MRHIILLTLFVSLSFANFGFAQLKTPNDGRSETIYKGLKTTIESNNYKFVGDWSFGNKKRSKLAPDSNYLIINSPDVQGLLSVLDKEDSPIAIKGKVTNYKVNYNDDKQEISIVFDVNDMKLYIDVKASGSIFLTLESNANTINQVGKIVRI